MFVELESFKALNPIREHIRLVFHRIEPDQGQEMEYLIGEILEKLKPNHSRAIVFCNSRRLTEESANEANIQFKGNAVFEKKAGYYHAGMSADDREKAYDGFKNGETLLLFATKAFGMGMDIPNIHYLYHYAPSSSFEDYLQEVGRAGRKSSAWQTAGFSKENPIRAICFYHKESFAKLKDRLQKNQASWNDFCNALEVFERYRQHIQGTELKTIAEPFPLPLNLLALSDKYTQDQASSVNLLFKLSLYWLQKANRLQATNYIPAYLEFENAPYLNRDCSRNITDPTTRFLFEYVYAIKQQKFAQASSTLVNGAALAQAFKEQKSIGKNNADEVYRWILRAQQQAWLRLINEVKINFTHNGVHEKDLQAFAYGSTLPQYLQCIKDIACEVLKSLKQDEVITFQADYLNKIANEIIQQVLLEDFISQKLGNLSRQDQAIAREYLTRPNLKKQPVQGIETIQQKSTSLMKLLQAQRKMLQEKKYIKKMRATFYLLALAEVKCVSQFSEEANGHVVQEVTLLGSQTEVREQIERLCQHGQHLFDALEKFIPKVDVNKLIIEAKLVEQGYAYTEKLLILLKKLGYINFSGGLVPMAINTFFTDNTPLNQHETDANIKDEYHETVLSKKLRLIVLEAFSGIVDHHKKEAFLKEYFKKKSAKEIAHLIEQYLSEAKAMQLLQEFRAEALKQKVEKLNDRQKEMYQASIRANISVLAGPGTGKTHTLVLRVARLIQEENISPRKILILAYNRAVVEELKVRLKDLFTKLGYKNLINTLRIHTFHSLVGKVLAMNQQEDLELDTWEEEFLRLYKDRDRRILKFFDEIEYAFVDEFQDITNQRLEILQIMAPPGKAFLTAIGDPNQSIYGYERANAGGSRSPEPYYEAFNKAYQPNILQLTTNYRSTQQIIDKAKKALPANATQIPIKAANSSKHNQNSYQKITSNNWKNTLKSLLNTDRRREIAIMFRSNEELYQAYPLLKPLVSVAGFELIIKGASTGFIKQREIAYIFDEIMATSAQKQINNKNRLRNYINDKVKLAFPQWNHQLLDDLSTLFEYYYAHYHNGSTYQDFKNFVIELTKRDDGQLMGLLKKANQEKPRKQVILTTIHRVKGLEFDYVMVPPSTARLPFDTQVDCQAIGSNKLQDMLAEEKRLLYVAFSRAKNKLIVAPGQREQAIYGDKCFQPNTQHQGIAIRSSDNNTVLSWKATQDTSHQFIHEQLNVGDALQIIKNTNGFYYLQKDGHLLEMLYNIPGLVKPRYSGVYVGSIVRYTAEECQAYDLKHNKNYFQRWGIAAQQRGYIYLVNFYGYVK